MNAWIRIPLRFLSLLTLGGVMLVALLTGGYFYVEPSIPDAASLSDARPQTPLTMYTRDSRLFGVYGAEWRDPVPFEAIPERVKQAFLSAEDARFYEHSGVDYTGILRGAVFALRNLVTGSDDRIPGGSTITQQVSRTAQLVGREYDPARKFREILLAYRIEKEFTKEEIFYLFLNTTFFGQRSNGVAQAARTYFDKTLDELTLGETAILAGIPQGPSIMNPYNGPENAARRRAYVVGQMFEQGHITPAEREAALAEPIVPQKFDPQVELEARFVEAMVIAWCEERFGPETCNSAGLRITTTLDSRLQLAANPALRGALEAYDRNHGYRGPLGRIDLESLGIELMAGLAAGDEVEAGAEAEAAALAGTEAGANADADADAEADAAGTDPGAAADMAAAASVLDEATQTALTTVLADYPNRYGTETAIVLAVDDLSADVYLRSVGVTRIGVDAIDWARAYISDTNRGDYPTVMGDVLAPGHIVSLRRVADGALELAQIPDPAGDYEYIQGALVALDPRDGAIVSLIGGYDFSVNQYNRVTQAERQPGSSFKPFLYLSALNRGYTLATIVNDAPYTEESAALERTRSVENYEGRFRGQIPFKDALYHSVNAAADRLIRDLGASYVGNYVERFGFDPTPAERNASLALGSLAVTPLELAAAYAMLANGGYAVGIRPAEGGPPRPYFVQRVETADGRLLYDARSSVEHVCAEPEERAALAGGAAMVGSAAMLGGAAMAGGGSPAGADSLIEQPSDLFPWPLRCAEQVESPQRIYLIKKVLKRVIRSGSGSRAWTALQRTDLFGKTGTTNDERDALFAGGNADIVAVARVGFDTDTRTLGSGEQGGRTAIPAWIDFMRVALAGMPAAELPRPVGISEQRVNPTTGLIAAECNRDFDWEEFEAGNLPAREPETACLSFGPLPDGNEPDPAAGPGSGASPDGTFTIFQ